MYTYILYKYTWCKHSVLMWARIRRKWATPKATWTKSKEVSKLLSLVKLTTCAHVTFFHIGGPRRQMILLYFILSTLIQKFSGTRPCSIYPRNSWHGWYSLSLDAGLARPRLILGSDDLVGSRLLSQAEDKVQVEWMSSRIPSRLETY